MDRIRPAKIQLEGTVFFFDDTFTAVADWVEGICDGFLEKKWGLVTDKINSNDRDFLSWEEVIRLKEEGFSFGAHTCSHSLLTSLSPEEARREIEQSKKIIEEKLKKTCEFFSYPYGEFDSTIQALIKEAGFLGAVVTPHGPGVKEGPHSLKRVGINKNNSMWVFKFKISGGFTWLREQGFLWKVLTKVKSLKRA
ncbi:hypothetical protein ES703_27996 [subsurface metagenome]